MFLLFSLPFLDLFRHFFRTPSPSPLSHPSTFFCLFWTCTNIDFEWLVVLLEPHCQQHRSLKELFMLHPKTGTNSTQVVLRWTCFYILVVIERIIEDCYVNRVSRATFTQSFDQETGVNRCLNTCVSRENKMNNICQIIWCRYYFL